MSNRFIQIHTLTSYPASLLNRDDAGFAKRMPFGGAVRTRISSQCLKRHWRHYDGELSLKSLGAPQSVRSRVSFERFIVEPLEAEGVEAEVARVAARKIMGKLLGSEAKQKKAEKQAKKTEKGGDAAPEEGNISAETAVRTDQVTVLGRPELNYLCGLARAACKEAENDSKRVIKVIDQMMKNDKELKKNIDALMPGSLEAGLGAALFGRMVTGDILSRTDAAVHVAHAMTVHGQLTESDYFSAIDELVREEGEAGSGHINASELTSGLFYGYVVVDVGGLASNLGGDSQLAGRVVHNLVHMMATVSPGAKKGSTAPYAYSHLVLLESGPTQPRTLANAFLDPVSVRGNVAQNAYVAMSEFLGELDRMYGKPESVARAHAGLTTKDYFGEPSKTLAQVATWAEQQVSR